MKVNPDYIARIRQLIGNYSKRTTLSPMDGSFKSTYRGKSMDFDDLREYVLGDDIGDIDWKSSMRSGTVLVKRYVAERRHSVAVICDSGPKMDADTPAGEPKSQLLMDTAGVFSLVAQGHGDDVAFLGAGASGIRFTGFRASEAHLQMGLADVASHVFDANAGIAAVLEHAVNMLNRRKVICLITDQAGIAGISPQLLRLAVVRNDLVIFDIDDAYLYGADSYDPMRGRYRPALLGEGSLARQERTERMARISSFADACRREKIGFQVVSSSDAVVPAVFQALRRNAEVR